MVQNVCFLTIFSNALHKVKEISIFSNDNHLEWMVRLSNIFLKRDHPSKVCFELAHWIQGIFSDDFWPKYI